MERVVPSMAYLIMLTFAIDGKSLRSAISTSARSASQRGQDVPKDFPGGASGVYREMRDRGFGDVQGASEGVRVGQLGGIPALPPSPQPLHHRGCIQPEPHQQRRAARPAQPLIQGVPGPQIPALGRERCDEDNGKAGPEVVLR
jgi:hypothetical protein